MSRAASFTQAQVTRAVKGVKDGGETPALVEIFLDGRIRVWTGDRAPAVDLAQESGDDWSEAIAAL